MFDEKAEETQVSDSQSSGWEDDSRASAGSTTAGECVEGFKRHRFAGGSVCIRCGYTKSEASATGTTRTRTATVKQGKLENLFSLIWLGAGYGIEKLPESTGLPGTAPKRDEEGEALSIAPTVAVGRALQMEAAVAGRRIDRAFARFPIYKVVAPWFEPAGAAADILPLLAAPLIAGMVAARPELGERLRGPMIAALIPVLVEQAKMAEAQGELLSKLEGVTSETLETANELVNAMLGMQPE